MTPIPASGKFKQCAACRSRQKDLTNGHRARKKATKVSESMSGGKKRARDDIPHEEEHLHQQARSHVSDNIPEITDNAAMEDEDGHLYGAAINQVNKFDTLTRCKIMSTSSQLPEDFLDGADLYNALRVQFNAGPDVKFYGTYPIIEDDLIVPKEATHQVAHEIWRLTGYRFT
jgi:hypothetical protein